MDTRKLKVVSCLVALAVLSVLSCQDSPAEPESTAQEASFRKTLPPTGWVVVHETVLVENTGGGEPFEGVASCPGNKKVLGGGYGDDDPRFWWRFAESHPEPDGGGWYVRGSLSGYASGTLGIDAPVDIYAICASVD